MIRLVRGGLMSDKMAADYTVLIVDDVPNNVMLVQGYSEEGRLYLLTLIAVRKPWKWPMLIIKSILLDILNWKWMAFEVLQRLKENGRRIISL